MLQTLLENLETFPLESIDFKTWLLQKYQTKIDKNSSVVQLKYVMYYIKFSRISDK
jgi:hypothetical protein